MHGDAPRSYLTRVPGWETPSEQIMLVNYAKQVPSGGLIVEIGAEFGMSTSLFCYASDQHEQRPRLVSVDLFPGNMAARHRENMIEAGYGIVSIERIVGKSAFVGLNWFDPIDLLFVDGDHTYKGVWADLEAWLPHVVEGGIIVFHDVAQDCNLHPHPQHFEVAAAIRDYLAENPGYFAEIDRVDSMLVVRKLAPTRVHVDGTAVEPD